MKKVNKRNIIIAIIILIAVIFETVAYRISQATKFADITANFVDFDGNCEDVSSILSATEKSNSGFSITLPEYIGTKKVESYIIEKKDIHNSDNENDVTKSNISSINAKSEEVKNILNTNTSINSTNTEIQNKNTTKNTNENTIKSSTNNISTNTTQNVIETKNNNSTNSISAKVDNTINTSLNNNEASTQENTNDTTDVNDEKILNPKDEFFLTDEEIKNKSVTIKAKYIFYDVDFSSSTEKKKVLVKNDSLTTNKNTTKQTQTNTTTNSVNAKNETTSSNSISNKEKDSTIYRLYEQRIQKDVDANGDGKSDNKISIEGLMPEGAEIDAKTAEAQEVVEKIQDEIKEKKSLVAAFDIKILYNSNYYEPAVFDTNVKVTIGGLNEIDEIKNIYEVIHIDDNNQKTKIDGIGTKQDEISFPAETFSTYAILLQNRETSGTQETLNASVWDGTVATSFRFGSGTQTNPYLISSAKELAYLASTVNSGTNYSGQYFVQCIDINLNSISWTPIGTTSNSFSGNYDGGGFSIVNLKIDISSMPTSGVKSYGLFGCIGNSSVKSLIRNVQIDNASINITASGTMTNTYSAIGWHVGIVSGTTYYNSEIRNVIVNNSTIQNSYTITLNNYYQNAYFGGIVGYTTYSENNQYDPGNSQRSTIENCYSDVDFNLLFTGNQSGWWSDPAQYLAQLSIGGIIGGIYAFANWPKNNLYNGSINSTNAFIGPIFGSVKNGTINGTSNYDNFWQGYEADATENMTSYFTNYSASGVSFTTSVASGTSSQRVSSQSRSGGGWSSKYIMGYVQGVNKGLYENSFNDMLNKFNSYVNTNTGNNFFTWNYDTTANVYYFNPVLSATVTKNDPDFTVVVNNGETIPNLTYKWYINNTLDSTKTDSTERIIANWTDDYVVDVLVSDGNNYTVANFTVKKLELHLTFNANESAGTITGNIEGTGTLDSIFNPNDYTYQWYEVGVIDGEEIIAGQTTNTISNIELGVEYKLVATNTAHNEEYMQVQGSYIYGDRIVVFVDYNNGNNSNDGFTPTTAVRTMSAGYGKLSSSGTINTNIIILMGNYTSDTSYINSANSSTYSKNATISGKYKGTDYAAVLAFEGTNNYRYLNGNTSFQHLTFNGQAYSYYGSGSNSEVYFFLQGYSLTMGNGIVMSHYRTANTNQGLITGNAPAFHIIAGWLMYDYSNLPRNNPVITIKSGTYGRIILGSSPGNSSVSTLEMYTSHNFTGTSSNPFNITINININESTTPSSYAYDVNLLVGGCACGNNYSNVTENITAGKVGRVLGGSIGDSSNRPDDWNYPINTYLGSSTINISGGSVNELYGGDLGRNMSAIGGDTYGALTCDSYYYGTININISGGTITKNIYGAGAGGVTGYNTNSSDNYKSFGSSYNTSVNINISGGTISGDIYGGGYGYTEYLTEAVTASDGGSLYGNSNITISGSPSIAGNIYGGSCGYDLSSKPNLAQMIGNSTILITGTPTINGDIYGASKGISGYEEMAKLTGTSNITVRSNLSTSVYGGGNIAKTIGTTIINLESGTLTADIYGGGNVGDVNGNTNVYLKGATATNIYCGGKSSDATNTNGYITSGTADTVYGGSNVTGIVESSQINATGGAINTVFGGNNAGGTCTSSNVNISGSKIGIAVYGGGNQVSTETTNVNINSSTDAIPAVYGGGNKGTADTTNVYMKGATVTDLYGGGNQASTTTTNVYATGGIATNIYGGGNSAGATTTNVHCSGTQITNAFGGSNSSGTIPSTNIEATVGNITNLYGGNNQGGTTTESHVNIKGGTVTNTYGGGNQAATTTTNVHTTGGIMETIYGGGNLATIQTSNVIIDGGTINKAFGGGNEGTATTSNVTQNSGVVIDLFGGGNKAGVDNTNVSITGGTLTNGYGGSNQSGTCTTTHITLEKTNTENNSQLKIFGGNNAGGTTTTSNVTINSGSANQVYGGNNANGDTITSNVIVNNGTITDVYGGNNLGGTTTTSNITINNGTINNVYGGGNQAVTNATNVTINSNIIESVYGGGNVATVNTNTNVIINGCTIGESAYGGGNDGIVTGNTNIHIKNVTIGDCLYAGGNGTTATVKGNATAIVEGTSTKITNSIFGGGNHAETGTEADNNSITTVKIAGGTIGKNVYGGANTSKVYGYTKTYIGKDATNDSTLEKGDIVISGTVFGGGEANASGSEEYDFKFTSVTKGIDVNIDGNGHTKFVIAESIFGSGNASNTTGYSNVTIKNYGIISSPAANVSIQRADTVTLDNSNIALKGAADRTNEYKTTLFSLSRIKNLKLKNNSAIFLDQGVNLVENFTSCVDINGTETKAAVTIDNGTVTKNTDNRLYMKEGKNLNIAHNEQATDYGNVYGMTFLGLYSDSRNPGTSTGIYYKDYNQGDQITNAGTFSTNSLVTALHVRPEHDTHVDGFYSNYDKEENTGYITVAYVGVTPENASYYIWSIGTEMDITTFEVSLTASKYATLGTYELGLRGFSVPNTKFILNGFSAGLEDGVSLVNPSEIQTIETNQTVADKKFGLSLKSGNTGWTNNCSTYFLTENGGSFSGTTEGDHDNSNLTPSINICLYHSENLSLQQQLGSVRVRYQAIVPVDDLNKTIRYIDIIISMDTALYQNDFFEGAITPGEQFNLFTSTETNITDSSKFSTYYSLYVPEFATSDYYDNYNTYHRVLDSRDSSNNPYVFPANTKITMIDMITNRYYYYVVTSDDVANNKYLYNLSDFVAMGSDSSKFSENDALSKYYVTNNDTIYENYIFHVDFSNNEIPNDSLNNSLLIELRDTEEQVLLGVLGIEREKMKYSVYKDKDSKIKMDASLKDETLYRGRTDLLTVNTNFEQTIIGSTTIYDTKFFDDKMGIKITMYDNNGNVLNRDSLLGVKFNLNGINYYPRVDGTTRIKIADKVSNVLSKITIDTTDNTTLTTGDYSIKIESFGSPDGIYYGLVASDSVTLPIKIIDSTFGLKETVSDTSKIINKDTGKNENGNNACWVNLEYSSALTNPHINVCLYRRKYDSYFSQEYELVNFKDYFTTELTNTSIANEYLLYDHPVQGSNNTFSFFTKETSLKTGTYKIVYKLYDNTTFIGEVYDYIVIK